MPALLLPLCTKVQNLGLFTSIGQIKLISNVQESHWETDAKQIPLQIELTTTELSQTEQKELIELLNSFSTLFVGDREPAGRTGVVKHDIWSSYTTTCMQTTTIHETY